MSASQQSQHLMPSTAAMPMHKRQIVADSFQRGLEAAQKGFIYSGRQDRNIPIPSTQPAVAMTHYTNVPSNALSQHRKQQPLRQPTQPVITESHNLQPSGTLPVQGQSRQEIAQQARHVPATAQKSCVPHVLHHQNHDGHAQMQPMEPAVHQAQALDKTRVDHYQKEQVATQQPSWPVNVALPKARVYRSIPKQSRNGPARILPNQSATKMTEKTRTTEEPPAQCQQEPGALQSVKSANVSDQPTDITQSVPQETQKRQVTAQPQRAQEPIVEVKQLDVPDNTSTPGHDTLYDDETASMDLIHQFLCDEYNAAEHLNPVEEIAESVEWTSSNLETVAQSISTYNDAAFALEANQDVEARETKSPIVDPDPRGKNETPSSVGEESRPILNTVDEEHQNGVDDAFGSEGFDWIGF